MTRVFDVVITYLEQTARRDAAPPAAPVGRRTAILRALKPPVHFYRYLYAQVGDPHYWVSRKTMSDAALTTIIHHDDNHLLVLYIDGAPAGLAELDARRTGVVEIKFFGLVPDYLGLGLGRFFLHHAIDAAWALGPERVTLETCSLDHPAALPLYQKFGFAVTGRRSGRVEVPGAADDRATEAAEA
ncbi:MAG: GNAT family N-acetyltransferase [Pseudomonadota bacterium]